MIDCVWKPFFSLFVACGAGGISVGVLYCFGGGAARRVDIQVNYKGGIFPRGFAAHFALRFRRQKSSPGTRIPPATQATLFVPFFS